MHLSAVTLLTLAASALALSVPKKIKDAPYSVAPHIVEAAIKCPNGITGKKGGIVYLIHGTGSTGPQSWQSGPFVQLLPNIGAGYDICYVDLPGFSTGDLQLSAEYVARGVEFLAPQSATGKVAIIGHSQGGGCNPQHALTYWPSIRPLVTNYIALAGDFHGTIVSNYALNEQNGATPANFQQSSESNYIAQQNSPVPGSGASAHVPTTSIFTYTDDIVQPQLIDGSSNLPGAGNHAIQDLDVCGPSAVADHFTLIASPQAFGLAVAALEHGSPVDLSKFDKTYCTYTKDNMFLNATSNVAFLNGVTSDLQQNQAPKQKVEPSLQPYVCERGFATKCGPAFAYQS
ncbi:hypothetical protein RQP46_010952 [Phenoliferia psychrophenolica]